MGIFKPFSSCAGDERRSSSERFVEPAKAVAKPARRRRPRGNPNPRRFTVEKVEEYGEQLGRDRTSRFVIVQVRYPDCTNYEGRKLLLYANTTAAALRARKSLDPHFCDHQGHLSPIARFEPTEAGWHYARALVSETVPQN